MQRITKKELDKSMKDNPNCPATKSPSEQVENMSSGNETKSSSAGQKGQIFNTVENLTADEATTKVHLLQNKILQGCIDIVEYSIELGSVLHQQRNSLEHGQWLNWIDKNINLGYTQISHYIRIYVRRDEIRQKMDELREQGFKPSFRKMLTAITKTDTRTLEQYRADQKEAEAVKKQKEEDKQKYISTARFKEMKEIVDLYRRNKIDANAALAMQERWNKHHPEDEFKFHDLFEMDEWGERATVNVTFEVDTRLWTNYYFYMKRQPKEFSKVINDYMRDEIKKHQKERNRESA